MSTPILTGYGGFDWCPDKTSRMEGEVQMEVIRLGGDYELRTDRGAHAYRRRLVMEFNKRSVQEVLEIERFFQGVRSKAFPIQDPDSGEWFQARIDGTIQRRPNGRLRDLVVGVLEVFEP
jgi:phage-related protein